MRWQSPFICEVSLFDDKYGVIGGDLDDGVLLDGDILSVDQVTRTNLGSLRIQHHCDLHRDAEAENELACWDDASAPPSDCHEPFRASIRDPLRLAHTSWLP